MNVSAKKISPPASQAVAKSEVKAPLFGEHYSTIRKLKASDLIREAAWKAPTNISAHLASLFNVLQVLAKKGLISPLLSANFAIELRRLASGLDRADPKTYAKASTIAGSVFRDYRTTCMGSPDNHDAARMVGEFLVKNEKDIGIVLQTLAVINMDQQSGRD